MSMKADHSHEGLRCDDKLGTKSTPIDCRYHSSYRSQWAGLPYPTQAGQVGGHEGVGKVVKLGPGSEQFSSVKVGDRVGVKWVSSACGSCRELCPSLALGARSKELARLRWEPPQTSQ